MSGTSISDTIMIASPTLDGLTYEAPPPRVSSVVNAAPGETRPLIGVEEQLQPVIVTKPVRNA